MFMTTFRSIQTRRNVIREDLKLCKERRERRHMQNDRNIYIYEHEAIRRPKSENNIGAPSAPQKLEPSCKLERSLSPFLGRICIENGCHWCFLSQYRVLFMDIMSTRRCGTSVSEKQSCSSNMEAKLMAR